MATLETVRPYVEQLFEDSDVQDYLGRSAANLRAAQRGAARAESKKRAIKDPRLHRRLRAAAGNAVRAGGSLRAARENEMRRQSRRRRTSLVLLLPVVRGSGPARVRARPAVGAAIKAVFTPIGLVFGLLAGQLSIARVVRGFVVTGDERPEPDR